MTPTPNFLRALPLGVARLGTNHVMIGSKYPGRMGTPNGNRVLASSSSNHKISSHNTHCFASPMHHHCKPLHKRVSSFLERGKCTSYAIVLHVPVAVRASRRKKRENKP